MKLWTKITALFRRRKLDADMAEEMRLHLERRTEENVASGMSPKEARYEALRKFGGVEQTKEVAREQRTWIWLEQSLADLRFAVRVLTKQRTFTLIAVLTLAVGIGAVSAILGLLRMHVLNPIPGHDIGRLVQIGEAPNRPDGPFYFAARDTTSLYVGQQLLQQPTLVDKATTFRSTTEEVAVGNVFQQINGAIVDAGFFDLIGVRPMRGRWLGAEEWQSSASDTSIVISHRFWQTRFGGEPDVVGKQLRVRRIGGGNETIRTIVGVMPPEFRFPAGDCEYWLPFRRLEAFLLTQPGPPNFQVFARLAGGLSQEKAQAAFDVWRAATAREFDANPAVGYKPGNRALRLRPLLDLFVEAKVRRSMWVVAAAAAFVLLIVCTNLALLQLARGEARKSEMAVRVALGAGRGRILRQLLIESLLLASAGGLGGLILAQWLRRLGDALLPTIAPVLQPTGVDGPTLGWTFGVAGVCGILFGFFPAWRAGDSHPAQVLQSTARTATGGRRWFQRGLVAGQVALAMILLCAAGLLLRSMVNLLQSDRGFDTAGLVAIVPQAVGNSFPNPEHRAAVTREVLTRLTALPGTESIGAVGMPAGETANHFFSEEADKPVELHRSEVSVGAADYFQALRLRLKAGRWFGVEDDRPGLKTVVVNAAAAEALWPGQSPVGKRLYNLPGKSALRDGDAFEVVGVVENMHFASLETVPEPTLFVPLGRRPTLGAEFYLRTKLPPAAARAAINGIFKELFTGSAAPKIAWLEEQLYASTAPRRMVLWSALALAGVGLFLAMLGLFGLQLHAVTARTREIGIRMALGADDRTVMRMIVAQGMAIVLIGVLTGTCGALWLTDALRGLLHGIAPNDPVTFTLMPVLLGAVALVACYLPARRAAKVDPIMALRAE